MPDAGKTLPMAERVTRLEEGVLDLGANVKEIKSQIGTLIQEVHQSRRPQWGNVVGFAGLALGISGGLWSLGITPLREQQNGTQAQASRNTDRVQALETREAAVGQKLAEVETQFHESRNIKNIQHEQALTWINLTRREAKLEPFDMPRFFPLPTNGIVK